jgi:hypothetical protein
MLVDEGFQVADRDAKLPAEPNSAQVLRADPAAHGLFPHLQEFGDLMRG